MFQTNLGNQEFKVKEYNLTHKNSSDIMQNPMRGERTPVVILNLFFYYFLKYYES